MANEKNIPNQTATEETAPVTYTEEQIREIYSEGQKAGYIAAIRQIRANVNDYLDNLIIATHMNQNQ